jgi:hypothetical protein
VLHRNVAQAKRKRILLGILVGLFMGFFGGMIVVGMIVRTALSESPSDYYGPPDPGKAVAKATGSGIVAGVGIWGATIGFTVWLKQRQLARASDKLEECVDSIARNFATEVRAWGVPSVLHDTYAIKALIYALGGSW